MRQANIFKCQECASPFEPEWDDEFDGYVSTKLCYHCFEAGVERAEERRLERIARSNEY